MYKTVFSCKSRVKISTLACTDGWGKFKSYSACELKRVALFYQKMKVRWNDYILNHVYVSVVTFQDVFKQKCYV